MSALRRLRGADQAIAFKPWIYEIAKNACIDEFRRGSRAREVPLEADGGEFVVDRQKSPVSSVPTPAAAVESKQRLDDLRGAFGGLSATHHQLLVMREFEGMSYDEIGQRLDMTRQMVESGLFRARRKLNEEYQELATGQRCEQIQTAIESGRLRAVSTLGIRDRRRCARHLAHCQPCRHAAHDGRRGRDAAAAAQHRREDRRAASVPAVAPALALPGRQGGLHRLSQSRRRGARGPHPVGRLGVHVRPGGGDRRRDHRRCRWRPGGARARCGRPRPSCGVVLGASGVVEHRRRGSLGRPPRRRGRPARTPHRPSGPARSASPDRATPPRSPALLAGARVARRPVHRARDGGRRLCPDRRRAPPRERRSRPSAVAHRLHGRQRRHQDGQRRGPDGQRAGQDRQRPGQDRRRRR